MFLYLRSLAEILEGYMAYDVSAAANRTQTELDVARRLQAASLALPQDLPLGSVSFDALYRPCDSVGGDWIGGFFHPRLRVLNVFVGDVTGHGIGSAILASIVSGAVQMEENRLDDSASAVDFGSYVVSMAKKLDALLKRSSDGSRGLSLAMLSLEIDTGTCRYLSAGHPFPVLHSAHGNEPRAVKLRQSSPLGGFGESHFECNTFQLPAGGSLFLFSDGILEARRADGRPFGYTGLKSAIAKAGVGPVPLAELFDESFFASLELDDDVTMVAVHRPRDAAGRGERR